MRPNVYYNELSPTMEIEFNDSITDEKVNTLTKQKYHVTDMGRPFGHGFRTGRKLFLHLVSTKKKLYLVIKIWRNLESVKGFSSS